MNNLFFLPLLCSLFSMGSMASAQSQAMPADALAKVIAAADSKNLASSRAWQKLLHIEKNVLGLRRSQISDPKFFLASHGARDAQAELAATLRGFTLAPEAFAVIQDDPLKLKAGIHEKITDHSQHPICQFPARLHFLKSQLDQEKAFWQSLPPVHCVFQDIYRNAVQAHSVSFVFSSYYANSPGSAFGHTFFRLNKKPVAGQKRQELLDYGAGYAANVTVKNPALYALFGLLGGFTGTWMNLPYYYKVREYNDFEARDLWSYDLALTPEEVEMVVAHLWEVGPHYYTYYFFTQNCAYHMLTLLEAAAPRLNLVDHVPFYVIPADSMKALFDEPGLVTNISFRPSIRRTFLARYDLLNSDTAPEFRNYAKDGEWPPDFEKWPDKNQALFSDAAIDLMDLRYPEAAMDPSGAPYKQKERLLAQRAQIQVVTEEPKISASDFDRPDLSHGSSRVGLGYYQNGDAIRQGFFEYRFALHDLLDPQVGLPGNSQLEFFNLKFQIHPNELQLDEFDLFRVFNLNPINFFEKKPSWGVQLGTKNMPYCGDHQRCYSSGLQFQAGYSVDYEGWIPWLMADLNLRYGEGLEQNRNYTAIGAEIGVLKRFTQHQALVARYLQEWPYQRVHNKDWEVQYRLDHSTKNSLGFNFKNSFGGLVFYHYF